jgi:amino acid adenylation domain-containing protein
MATKNAALLSSLPVEKRELLSLLLQERAGEFNTFPLSFAQQRLWFISQLEPGSSLYNLATARRLRGPLDVQVLEQTLTEIIRRHETLRTSIVTIEGQPVQVILPSGGFRLPVTDLSRLPLAEREMRAQHLAAAEAARPFDLAEGPLLRTELLRLAPDDHVFLVTMHHIISDGWSLNIFFRELGQIYHAYSQGKPSPLSELAVQHADYVVWQREHLSGERLAAELAYWKKQLSGAPPVLELPTTQRRPAAPSYRGGVVNFKLSHNTSDLLEELSQRQGVTLFMTLLAAFVVLLARLSQQEDIVVGTPTAGRTRAEVEPLIGFFVNTLALRTKVRLEQRFDELLQVVKEVCLEAYSHQDIPFEKFVEELQPERSLSYQPLFQVMFQLQNARGEAPGWPSIEMSGFKSEATPGAPFDLTLVMTATSAGLSGTLQFATDIFVKEEAEKIVERFERLLDSIATDESQMVGDLPIIISSEMAQLLGEWNDTAVEYPSEACLAQLFEDQVQRTPNHIALRCGAEELTYLQLNQQANQLGHYLKSKGIGSKSLVGLCVERSSQMIVALLAILKTGAAYVPLDPHYPAARLSFMLADSGAELLLTRIGMRGTIGAVGGSVIFLDGDERPWEQQPVTNVCSNHSAENLAYVIYTSGSTGQPKGVMVTHRNLVNMLSAMQCRFPLTGDDVLLALTTLSFDIAALELYLPLLSGACLALYEGAGADSRAVLRAVKDHGATIIQATPTTWRLLLEDEAHENLNGVRVLCGGEALNEELAAQLCNATAGVWNMYGPTETTVWSLTWQVRAAAGRVSLGHPIDNTEIYILDRLMNLTPVGVPGELFIGGDGVARGYLHKPELTAERFVPNPFARSAGTRLYRTGDVCRYRRNGEVEYLGRTDHQVKVRGHRIELGEIESALMEQESVREAVAVVRADETHDQRLVAYFTTKQGLPSTFSELYSHLKARLPDYMMPSVLVHLDALPLTPNGKIDRSMLPVPDEMRPVLTDVYETARTPVEEVLVKLWAEILRLKQVGIRDNFFELGGHSLLATRLITRIRDIYSVDLPLLAVFESPTIAEVAVRIEAERESGRGMALPPVSRVPRDQPLALSYAQQRLWFLAQLEPGSPFYNFPTIRRLIGPLDVTALRRALDEIVRRHDSLRTSFIEVSGRPVQVVLPHRPLELSVVDLRHLPANERELEARRLAKACAIESFDLAQPPLLRASLLRLGDQEHVLLLTIHHIISDGWSIGVFFREAIILYNAFREGKASPLSELKVQYADFAAWQQEWLQGAILDKQLAYWRNQLAGAPFVLDLPADHPRPPVQTYRGSVSPFTVPLEVTEALRELSQREGTTLFMTLLAAYYVLLYRYTGVDDLIVGSPTAGRNRSETEGLIGFFVNTLVLRTRLKGEMSFRELMREVRDVCLGAYANQDVAYQRLIEELQPERTLSHQALVQVMFHLRNAPRGRQTFKDVTMSGFQFEDDGISKVDLMLELSIDANGLFGTMQYTGDLFEEATILRMIGHFQTLLTEIVADPSRKVSALRLLSSTEEKELLTSWSQTRTISTPADCVHQLFEKQVQRTPDAFALIHEELRVTYRELNERSEQLAQYLRTIGVAPDILVGLLVERSINMIVSLLAVLKAGGAYLPLDPEYPDERLAFMLADSGTSVLLTQRHLRGHVPAAYSGKTICLESLEMASRGLPTNISPTVAPENAAYVIYTSGSTGRPKGVVVEHRSLVCRVVDMIEQYGLQPGDRHLQFISFGHDAFAEELFPTLASGGVLVLVDNVREVTPGELLEKCRSSGVSKWIMTASYWHQLVEELNIKGRALPPTLKVLVTGGESPSLEKLKLFKQLARQPIKLINEYGPTEATIVTASHSLSLNGDQSSITIGRPVANVQVYVVDPHDQPVPAMIPGELLIGGDALARGYLHSPDLTAEKFIPDSFGGVPGARLYRSGDRVRYLADGRLEFLGRLDSQIKVRGYRIELGEIEAALEKHECVRECVVVGEQEAGGDRIIAYLVTNGTRLLDDTDWQRYLSERLPSYMIPSAFVVLDSLPRSANGKVERKALPVPVFGSAAGPYVPPRTEIEALLADIWREVLKVESISVHDNFFALGGHSLLAIQVLSRINAIIRQHMQVRQLFETPTIAGLAEQVSATYFNATRSVAPPLKKRVQREAHAPASYEQERLWFIDRLEPNSPAYNFPVALRLKGKLNREALERSVAELVWRHETLRTSFVLRDGNLMQLIEEPPLLTIPVEDLTMLPVAEREPAARRLTALKAETPFDLSRGPLLRTSLLRLAADEHVLLLMMHHIVNDAWSMGVVMRELAVCYNAFVNGGEPHLPPLPIQYADYAVWQRQWLQGAVLEEQLHYWREQLAGAPEKLALPTDRPRPQVPSYRGSTKLTSLSQEMSQRLRDFSRGEDVTLFMLLLAGWQLLFSYYSGQLDIVMGTNVANRVWPATEGLVGFFINPLTLRVKLFDNPTCRDLLGRVREITLGAYAHQEVPFAKVVEALNPKRARSHGPLFQVKINFVNTPRNDGVSWQGLRVQNFDFGEEGCHFDLTLSLTDSERGLRIALQYDCDLFMEKTIDDMLADYEFILDRMSTDPEMELETLGALVKERMAARRHRQIQLDRQQQQQKLTNLKRKFVNTP